MNFELVDAIVPRRKAGDFCVIRPAGGRRRRPDRQSAVRTDVLAQVCPRCTRHVAGCVSRRTSAGQQTSSGCAARWAYQKIIICIMTKKEGWTSDELGKISVLIIEDGTLWRFFCLKCTLNCLNCLVPEDNLSYNDITYDYIKFNLTEPTEQAM